MTNMTLDFDQANSPIGEILFVSNNEGICALDYAGFEDRMRKLLARRFGAFEFRPGSDPHRLKPRLRDYFAGKLNALERTPVSTGGTAFQAEVWRALREIPAGETRTYGRLAERLGRPQAARAVGHANSLNPVAIIVPCHRVIGSSSALTGYAGGLDRKEWLLRHEQGIGGQRLKMRWRQLTL
jgi:methylated-DNA-[protein]-cysteine S-methyltransferase